MKPVVALIGRPNVGKSTFFNRITKSKDAIVDNFPGVTRDRHYGKAKWDDKDFILIDTGGFLAKDEDAFAKEIRFQVLQAIEDADVIVLIMDGKAGISPFDRDLVEIVRNLSVPVMYVVNKIDGEHQEQSLYDFYAFGMDELYSVSAEHGYGVIDFLDDLIKKFPDESLEDALEDVIKIAVVGRPNSGKSSLINKIIGKKRLVVSDVAGTTRDAVDSFVTINDKKYCMIDTAGIRRKSKVSAKIEKFSIIKALKSLERCDVALIILDASEGITDQDITVAGYAFERGCGCVFLINKWDIVENKDHKTLKRYYEELQMQAKFLSFAPAMTISALTGLRVNRIFNIVDEVYEQYSYRIGTGQLNRIIEKATTQTEPSLHKGKRLKFYYATQVSSKPPTFVCFVNYPEAVHFSYKRYLINQIRQQAGLDKTPIKLFFRLRTGKIDFSGKKTDKQKQRRTKKKR